MKDKCAPGDPARDLRERTLKLGFSLAQVGAWATPNLRRMTGWMPTQGTALSRLRRRWDYCAVRKTGNSPSRTAQSGGESEEGRRSAPLGRVRGEG